MAPRCVRAARRAGSIVCGLRVSSRVMSSKRSISAAIRDCQSVSAGSLSTQSRVWWTAVHSGLGSTAMSVLAVALTQIACVRRAWGFWSSAPRAVPSMVGMPWVVMKSCTACCSCTRSGLRRCMTSIVVTPGSIFFQSMLAVSIRHVVVLLRVWLSLGAVGGFLSAACGNRLGEMLESRGVPGRFLCGPMGFVLLVGSCSAGACGGLLGCGVCVVPVSVVAPKAGDAVCPAGCVFVQVFLKRWWPNRVPLASVVVRDVGDGCFTGRTSWGRPAWRS